MKLKALFVSLALVSAAAAPTAAIELVDGGVYRFVSNTCSKVMRGPSTPGTIVMADRNDADLSQMWLVSGNDDNSGYYVRNLQTGYYMTSPIKKE